MIRIYYAEKDTTLYEKYPTQNTGIDQILELTKISSGSKFQGEIQANTYNSRILIDFGSQITSIKEDIDAGIIPTTITAHLKLYAANASDLLQTYNIEAYPVSESWVNGGGNYSDTPIQKYGTSWYYRSSDDIQDQWNTGSAASVGQMGTTETLIGGGTWMTGSGYESSQSFQNESPDLRIDITDIVSKWTDASNALTNYGLIIKRPSIDEISGEVLGKLQFFSRETHTIYVPRLEISWDDYVNDGGTNPVTANVYTPYIKNIKSEYRTSDVARFLIGARPEFPVKSYSTASFYNTNERLPASSSYSIYDSITNDVIIQDENIWSNSKTKISNGSIGTYFDLRMDSFMPERYYKIQLKCIRTTDVQTFDDFYFKVVR
jgi:hypothetical protein